VLQFSPAQYAGREAWNAGLHASYHHVPRPFDEGQRISWTPLWSLARKEFRYLPTTYCYYGSPDRNGFCIPDSNGCAAGNTIEEAVLQGFLELVERDCVALWWYNRIRHPAVDVDSFGLGDYHRTLQAFYRSHGRSLWVLDLTADLGISTFAAISGRVDSPVEDIIVGYGAHLDPQIALLRALTELNQFLPMVIHRSPDGSTWYPVDDQDTLAWFKTATMAANSYLVPDPSQPARTAADHPSRSTDDMRADVEVCVAAAAAVGLDTLVLDQTRPDIGLAVCRVVVPGLRHFWRRLGPGRLYDIPVQLGWLAAPTAEQDMNPVSMFF
jgi:oxazoline/thiazoline synthase